MSDEPAIAGALRDGEGAFSSRRVAAFVALACLVIAFLVLLGCLVVAFAGGRALPGELVGLVTALLNIMAAIALGGLGLATADRWAPRKD